MNDYKVVVGAALAAVGAGFLSPFVQAVISDEDVELWPNPLFIIPLVVFATGLLLLFSPVLGAVRDHFRPRAMTHDDLQRISEEAIWGRSSRVHWSSAALNTSEGELYLRLDRRFTNAATFRCEVRDPEGFSTSKQFAQDGPTIIVRYPADFKDARTRYESAPHGRYRVTWSVQMLRANSPYMKRVQRQTFRVPTGE